MPNDHNVYDIDCANPFENDIVFSIISSFMEELSVSCDIMLIEKHHDPIDRYKRFMTYLSDGIEMFNYMILMDAYDDYDANSLDSLFAIIIIGLHYGINTSQYLLTKTATFDEAFYKPLRCISQQLDLFITNCVHNRQYLPPIKQLNNSYFSERDDINCYKMNDKCTIGLVGNWATGKAGSISVIKAIKQFNPKYFIHLGNVYQSGRITEHINSLILPVKQYLPNAKVFIVPGEHSYYSGTQGVEYSLKAFSQNATYFSLYNKHVQFQAIDATFTESVNKDEVDWHTNRVSYARANGRRIIYLSHMAPVSLWKTLGVVNGMTTCINPTLHNQFSHTVDDLDAWFFSQERSFNLMAPYTYNDHVIVRPRLIGNSSATYATENLNDLPGDFETSFDMVPLPQPISVYPNRYLTMLNPTFVIIKINKYRINIRYYQLPQVEMGRYNEPELLYQEIIML